MSPRQLSAREKSDSRVWFSVQHSDANLFKSHYRFVYLFDYIVKMLKYYRKQLKIDALDWTSDKRRKSNSLSRQQNEKMWCDWLGAWFNSIVHTVCEINNKWCGFAGRQFNMAILYQERIIYICSNKYHQRVHRRLYYFTLLLQSDRKSLHRAVYSKTVST